MCSQPWRKDFWFSRKTCVQKLCFSRSFCKIRFCAVGIRDRTIRSNEDRFAVRNRIDEGKTLLQPQCKAGGTQNICFCRRRIQDCDGSKPIVVRISGDWVQQVVIGDTIFRKAALINAGSDDRQIVNGKLQIGAVGNVKRILNPHCEGIRSRLYSDAQDVSAQIEDRGSDALSF